LLLLYTAEARASSCDVGAHIFGMVVTQGLEQWPVSQLPDQQQCCSACRDQANLILSV
jgi:hypothetical protein